MSDQSFTTIGFRPLNGQVIVEPLEEAYTGVIIIPDNVKKERPTRGRVRAMGPGMLMKSGARWPMPDCKPGDEVIYRAEGSMEFKLSADGVKLVAVRDSQVLAIIDRSDEQQNGKAAAE